MDHTVGVALYVIFAPVSGRGTAYRRESADYYIFFEYIGELQFIVSTPGTTGVAADQEQRKQHDEANSVLSSVAMRS